MLFDSCALVSIRDGVSIVSSSDHPWFH